MRVLMLVQNDFINDARVFKEANTLGQQGHTVQILALHSKDLSENESFKSFAVHRVVLRTREKLSKRNKYIQSIKYFEFFKKCVDYAKEFKPDIIHCHDVYTIPIGFKIRKKTKGMLIYDSHELWSRVHNVESSPRLIKKITNFIERKAIRECDKVITVSDSISNYFVERYEIDNMPIVLRNIPNISEQFDDCDIFREKFNIAAEKKIILYQGAVQLGRGVDTVISLLQRLNSNIVLVILGNGPLVSRYKDLVEELGLSSRVFFHEAVSQYILKSYTSSADFGIHLMENTCLNHYYALPNKLFEYIQSGIPIICSDFPEMKKIVDSYKVGLTVDPQNIDETAKKINEFVLTKNSIEVLKENVLFAKKNLNWENEERILIKLYDELKDLLTLNRR